MILLAQKRVPPKPRHFLVTFYSCLSMLCLKYSTQSLVLRSRRERHFIEKTELLMFPRGVIGSVTCGVSWNLLLTLPSHAPRGPTGSPPLTFNLA